jgi:hypothetical protein
MAYVGSTNVAVANGAGTYLFTLKQALTGIGGAGWTLLSSSNGTIVSSVTDQVPNATEFAKANAWARVREPLVPGGIGQREYVLQNGTLNGTTAIIKYSRATGFSTGGTATVAPTTGGGDGQVMVGTGTDAAPVAAAFANATGIVSAVASDTASPGVYGGFAWYLIGYTIAPVANVVVALTEHVTPGSTSSVDQDPMWRYGTGSGAPISPQQGPLFLGGPAYSNAAPGVQWWQAYGLALPSYIRGGTASMYVGRTPTSLTTFYETKDFTSVSPYDGKEPLYPALVSRSNISSLSLAAVIPKGFSTGMLHFAATHNLLDTFNLNTADPKVVVSLTTAEFMGVAVPWITNIVPTV